MAEDEDDPAVFWPLFETTGSDANEFGEDVGFVRDAMRCDAMRCDAMGWDGMRCDGGRRETKRRRGRTGRGERDERRNARKAVGFVDD